jgi:hypothetical protein
MASDTFAKRYWALQVAVPNGAPVTVSCNKYLISPYTGATGDWVAVVQAKQDRIRALQQKAQAKKLSVRPNSFTRALYGKGTPQDLEHVLGMAAATGTAGSALQTWADNNLGVDCTGFVVAYFDSLGWMDADKYLGGTGCDTFYDMARRLNKTGFIIWNIDDVQPDDIIVWMYANGQETKHPGHISLVYNKVGNSLMCGESNGGGDGQGHSGPRLQTRQWNGETGSGGQRRLKMDQWGVIVIRAFGGGSSLPAGYVFPA